MKIKKVLVCTLFLAAFPTICLAVPPEGDGTLASPYLIDSCADLEDIATNIADYNDTYSYYRVISDLDCTASGNAVIMGDDAQPFTGEFDGNGLNITLDISTDASNVGLFGVAVDAVINDLSLDGSVEVTGDLESVGSLVGLSTDTVINKAYSQATVTADGSDNVGGLIGKATGLTVVNHSYYDGVVTGLNKVGGIAGLMEQAIDVPELHYCYSTGQVNGDDYVGGLVGEVINNHLLEYNFSVAEVVSAGQAGGIFGNITDFALGTRFQNYYDEITSGLGADSCLNYNDGGLVTADEADACEGVDTTLDDTYFYTEANAPFTVTDTALWNFEGDYFETWYFAGDDYPQLHIFLDSGDVFSGDGSGTEEDPYIITTCDEFEEITYDPYGYYLLDPADDAVTLNCTDNGNDIMYNNASNQFRGVLDGGSNTIVVDIDFDGSYVGLFSRTKNATITDLNVSGSVTSTGDYTGGIAGYFERSIITDCSSAATIDGGGEGGGGLFGNTSESIITDCYSSGEVTAGEEVGGLVGRATETTIDSSYATGDIASDVDWYVGGAFGVLEDSTVTDSYATGDVYSTEGDAGGFVGQTYDSDIDNCYSTGDIDGGSSDQEPDDQFTEVGGFVGDNDGTTITDSFSLGDISNSIAQVGGFAGINDDGVITNCFATGDIYLDGLDEITNDIEDIGGFVGYNDDGENYESFTVSNVTVISDSAENIGGFVGYTEDGYIEDAYAKGDVFGYDYVGGFAGYAEDDQILNSYSTGEVTTDNEAADIGGFIGYDDGIDSDFNFWDTETSGQEDSDGDETGKTTLEMKDIDTFTTDIEGDEWDFDDVWDIDEDVNDGYPFLRFVQPESPSDLSSSDVAKTTVNLSWLENDEDNGPEVYYNVYNITDDTESISEETTSVIDGLECGTKYFFEVRTVVGEVESSLQTNTISFTTTGCNSGSRGGGGGGGAVSSNTTSNTDPVETPETVETETELETPIEFTDIKGHWAEEYILTLRDECGVNGYVDGDGKFTGIFGPNNSITRSELVKMVIGCEFSDVESDIENNFNDVDSDKWYYSFILKALEEGWVSGYSDGTFKPGKDVTRVEALKIILLAGFQESEIFGGSFEFDDADINAWYAKYLSFAVLNDFVNGYKDSEGNLTGIFGVSDNLTRAEAAKIIVNVLGL